MTAKNYCKYFPVAQLVESFLFPPTDVAFTVDYHQTVYATLHQSVESNENHKAVHSISKEKNRRYTVKKAIYS